RRRAALRQRSEFIWRSARYGLCGRNASLRREDRQIARSRRIRPLAAPRDRNCLRKGPIKKTAQSPCRLRRPRLIARALPRLLSSRTVSETSAAVMQPARAGGLFAGPAETSGTTGKFTEDRFL